MPKVFIFCTYPSKILAVAVVFQSLGCFIRIFVGKIELQITRLKSIVDLDAIIRRHGLVGRIKRTKLLDKEANSKPFRETSKQE